MDESGNARIVDFGLATVTQNPDSMQNTSCQHGHTPRWTAPEVLREGPYSKESDTFAFAMVMIEVRHGGCTTCRAFANYRSTSMKVYTGAVPFRDISTHAATFAIMQGDRPPRPTDPAFTDDLWTLMQRCWNQHPHLRPEASEALEVLLAQSVSRSYGKPCFCQFDCLFVYSQQRTWKLLIGDTSSTDERISLITTIFSDHRQIEMVEQLSGDEAQALVDRIDEVGLHTVSCPKDELIGSHANLRVLFIRYWIA